MSFFDDSKLLCLMDCIYCTEFEKLKDFCTFTPKVLRVLIVISQGFTSSALLKLVSWSLITHKACHISTHFTM